jgi:hypothetical protein
VPPWTSVQQWRGATAPAPSPGHALVLTPPGWPYAARTSVEYWVRKTVQTSLSRSVCPRSRVFAMRREPGKAPQPAEHQRHNMLQVPPLLGGIWGITALGGAIRPSTGRETTRKTCLIWQDYLSHNVTTPRKRAPSRRQLARGNRPRRIQPGRSRVPSLAYRLTYTPGAKGFPCAVLSRGWQRTLPAGLRKAEGTPPYPPRHDLES